jgi:hypothetical protein
MTSLSVTERIILKAVAEGDITWENDRPEFGRSPDYHFVWCGTVVDYAVNRMLWGFAQRGLFEHQPGLPLTDAGRHALRVGQT